MVTSTEFAFAPLQLSQSRQVMSTDILPVGLTFRIHIEDSRATLGFLRVGFEDIWGRVDMNIRRIFSSMWNGLMEPSLRPYLHMNVAAMWIAAVALLSYAKWDWVLVRWLGIATATVIVMVLVASLVRYRRIYWHRTFATALIFLAASVTGYPQIGTLLHLSSEAGGDADDAQDTDGTNANDFLEFSAESGPNWQSMIIVLALLVLAGFVIWIDPNRSSPSSGEGIDTRKCKASFEPDGQTGFEEELANIIDKCAELVRHGWAARIGDETREMQRWTGADTLIATCTSQNHVGFVRCNAENILRRLDLTGESPYVIEYETSRRVPIVAATLAIAFAQLQRVVDPGTKAAVMANEFRNRAVEALLEMRAPSGGWSCIALVEDEIEPPGFRRCWDTGFALLALKCAPAQRSPEITAAMVQAREYLASQYRPGHGWSNDIQHERVQPALTTFLHIAMVISQDAGGNTEQWTTNDVLGHLEQRRAIESFVSPLPTGSYRFRNLGSEVTGMPHPNRIAEGAMLLAMRTDPMVRAVPGVDVAASRVIRESMGVYRSLVDGNTSAFKQAQLVWFSRFGSILP